NKPFRPNGYQSARFGRCSGLIAASLAGTPRPRPEIPHRPRVWPGGCRCVAFDREHNDAQACHTEDARATSFGQTVTSSLLRHWTMIGVESVLSPARSN